VRDHETLERFARGAEVPVVNGVSDRAHPDEALADLYFLTTWFESLDGLAITWVGDCTNVARSFVSVCLLAGADVRVTCPAPYRFDTEFTTRLQSRGSGSLRDFEDPVEAVEGTAAVYTDRWVSMGREAEPEGRLDALAAYQLNRDLLSHAPEAIVMHCLHATRGEGITVDVLDGDRSVVCQQAKTRLPMQQVLLDHVYTNTGSSG
jgi:ornithine carbamoyltransferase